MSDGRRDDGTTELAPSVAGALLRALQTGDDPVLVVALPIRRNARDVRHARIEWSNQAAVDLLGNGVLAGAPLASLLPGADLDELLHPERPGRITTSAATARGELLSCEIWATAGPVTPLSGWSPEAVVGRTERLWVVRVVPAAGAPRAAALRVSEERFATLAHGSPVATVVSDVGARLSHVNDAFLRLLGTTAEEVLGTRWLAHVADDDRGTVVAAVADVLAGDPVEAEVRLRAGSGAPRLTHLRMVPSRSPGHGAGFIATFEDVTEQRAREHRLTYQAHHDLLTGLPNRLALLSHVTDVLEAQDPTDVGVLLVDLDDFKTVNDGLGPEAGDEVLVEVARRLQSTMRTGDLVSRPGGDEFVLVCHGLVDAAAIEATVARVLGRLQTPVEVDGVQLRLDASVGVVRLAGARGCAEEVVRDAEIAAHEAKAAGGGRWTVLDDDVRHRARHTLRLIGDLRDALSRGSLDVHYQPIVRPDRSGRPAELVSVEALCRWQHPEFGSINPETFIQLAERCNLVPAVDAAVLRRATLDLASWRQAHARGLLATVPDYVAVNVSAVTLSTQGFAAGVRGAVTSAGLQPTDLCLEVTETSLASDLRVCRAVLEELRAEGVRVAIDDFGTGYSSLSYLKDLPADHLKIDRSFVQELRATSPLPGAAPARAVATAVVSLARALGLGIVAEGVETREQDDVLAELGCDLVQGYLYARPMGSAALAELLREAPVLRDGPVDDPTGAPEGGVRVGVLPRQARS